MARKAYVFVNWDEKDIISTTSHPGEEIMGKDAKPHQTLPGRRANQLIIAGYRYYGCYSGWNLGIIR